MCFNLLACNFTCTNVTHKTEHLKWLDLVTNGGGEREGGGEGREGGRSKNCSFCMERLTSLLVTVKCMHIIIVNVCYFNNRQFLIHLGWQGIFLCLTM